MDRLIGNGDSFASFVSDSDDQSNHLASFVTRSRMTLLSTSVYNDYFRVSDMISSVESRTVAVPLSRRTIDSPREIRTLGLYELNRVSSDHEINFRLRHETEAFANILRNRDLSLRRDSHSYSYR